MNKTMNTANRSADLKAPVAVALDAPSLPILRHWIDSVSSSVSTLKIGMEVFYRDGDQAVDAARDSGCDLFLDLKLHDIPNTVAGAARSLSRFNPHFLTVHASGGAQMISAACEALPDTLITGVTILTSFSDQQIRDLGFAGTVAETVEILALNAVAAGARALVCSPHEVARVRELVPDDIVLITPGVRPRGAQLDDQKRVMTPEEAITAGADLLVVGRPITGARDITSAARALADSLENSESRVEMIEPHK